MLPGLQCGTGRTSMPPSATARRPAKPNTSQPLPPRIPDTLTALFTFFYWPRACPPVALWSFPMTKECLTDLMIICLI